VLSWVNETNTEELQLQFSSFLGAHQGVFGPFGVILISNPPGAGHAFPRHQHMRKGGGWGVGGWGGVIYLCQGFLLCMMPSMDGWMDGSRDEKSFTKNDHDVFYYM
jgi:hypothetical protein